MNVRDPLRWIRCRAPVAAIALVLVLAERAPGQDDAKAWRVPVVMEEATVRGKVVILETRREDRKTVGGLRIEVWTTEPDNPRIRDERIHRTRTDDEGLFSLPSVEIGRYVIIVGELRLGLQVVPKANVRADQQEPKVLLILLPKDVV